MGDGCIATKITPLEIKQGVVDALTAAHFSPLEPAGDFVWGVIDSRWPCEPDHNQAP